MPIATAGLDKLSATSELALLLGLTERLYPKCRKSMAWRRARASALEAALKADTKAGMWHDLGTHDISSADEIDDEEPAHREDLSSTLERHLGRPLRHKLKAPAEHDHLISAAKDRLIQLEKVVRESGTKYDADRIASAIMRIEQIKGK